MSSLSCHLLHAGALTEIPLEHISAGGYRLKCVLERGFYQFSVVADGSNYDWDAMVFPLHLYGNTGQMTGPWDFNLLDHNRPLIPSYWVSVNRRRIGLWFFQRVAFEDIEPKRFRGRFAFYCSEPGEHEIEMVPYSAKGGITWLDARLEPDPESTLYSLKPLAETGTPTNDKLPFERKGAASYWRKRPLLPARIGDLYEEALSHLGKFAYECLSEPFDMNLKPGQTSFYQRIQSLPALLICWKRFGDAQVLQGLSDWLKAMIEAPHWGGYGNAESYGTDGDINGALIFFYVTSVFSMLKNDLECGLLESVREKLREQGSRFFDLSLLNRDYWGGSILQDHGWRSLSLFGTAALHLRREIPEAELWASLMVSKIDRAIAIAPADGALPVSSYRSLRLFVNPLVGYREALMQAEGVDIFDYSLFSKIPDYLATLLPSTLDVMALESLPALNALAAKFKHPWLAARYHDGLEAAIRKGAMANTMEAFFWHRDIDDLPEGTSAPSGFLSYFEESGLVLCSDPERRFRFALQCGPAFGSRGWRSAQGPCDRLDFLAGVGHFDWTANGTEILGTPSSTYKMTSATRSVLLVDGKGSTGDIGYPMSLPTNTIEFGEIVFARMAPCGVAAEVRLNLKSAYPRERGILSYYRDFRIDPVHGITVTDSVLLDRPHLLAWLFQIPEDLSLALEAEGLCRLGGDHIARWESAGGPLAPTIAPTDTVFSYSGTAQQYRHLRLETIGPVERITFKIAISPSPL